MDQWYVQMYYIPLFVLCLFAVAVRDRDFTFITCLSVVAFVATRLVTFLPEGSRLMFDFSNDLAVCAILIYFMKKRNGIILKNNKMVPFLILTYTAMMVSYIIFLFGGVTYTQKVYMREAISIIQLLLIFGGIINGRRRLFRNIFDDVRDYRALVGSKITQAFTQRVERSRDNKPDKNRVKKLMAKDS